MKDAVTARKPWTVSPQQSPLQASILNLGVKKLLTFIVRQCPGALRSKSERRPTVFLHAPLASKPLPHE